MNYEDEDYVRYYTRDTVSWMALGWEGQTVLSLMLHGKFDRSGVFDCDGHTPSHAVTLVTRIPEDVVERGLGRILKSKTWVHHDGKLVWPKFLEAQTCRRSDKVRQRESRENRRKQSLGQPVTPCDIGHEESHVSQTVTLSRAEPSRAEKEDPPTPLPGGIPEPVPANGRRITDRFTAAMTTGGSRNRPDVLALFDDWKALHGQPEARLCVGMWDGDADTLAEALDAYGPAKCKTVLAWSPNDGMVSGRDDEKRVRHNSIGYIFGNKNAFLRMLGAARAAAEAKQGGSFSSVIDRAKGIGA